MTTTPGSTAAVRRPARHVRTLLAAALAAVGLVVLAGCMKIDMAFTLSEEDTVSGTMVMGISDAFAESLGMDPQELWDSANEGEDGLTSDLPEGSTQEPYADGEYTGIQVTYADQRIEDMSTGGDLSITREGDEYVVEGVMDLTDTAGTEASEEVPAEILDTFLMRVSATFPGEISETNGTVDGTTVTWEPKFGERNELTARGSAVAGGGAAGGTDDGAGDETAEESTEPGAGAGDDTGADDGTDESTDDAMVPTVAADTGFPGWALAVGILVALAVVGVVVTLIVRNNRPATPGTDQPSSNPQDLFSPTTPPSHQHGQPPVDPYHPGGTPPQQDRP